MVDPGQASQKQYQNNTIQTLNLEPPSQNFQVIWHRFFPSMTKQRPLFPLAILIIRFVINIIATDIGARVTVDAITSTEKRPEYNATIEKKCQMPRSGVGVRAGQK